MTRVALVSGGRFSSKQLLADYLVAVDRACLSLVRLGYHLTMAVGDFDSVSAVEKEEIRQASLTMVEANSEKDDTDTELALLEIFKKWPEADVTIYGAFGGRLDHEFSNLFLPSHPRLFPFMRQIRLVDEQNAVRFLPQGKHFLTKNPNMTYIAFLLEGEGQLELAGCKYPLNAQNYFKRKMYSSNEFLEGPIEVTVPDGYVIVVETRDKE